jgi:hypothetical protein
VDIGFGADRLWSHKLTSSLSCPTLHHNQYLLFYQLRDSCARQQTWLKPTGQEK